MDENKLYKSLIICVLVLAFVSLATFAPRLNVAGYELKEIDLFSDLRNQGVQNKPDHITVSGNPAIFDLTWLPYFRGFTRYLAATDGISPLFVLRDFAVPGEEMNKRLVLRINDNRLVSLKSMADLLKGPALLEDFSPDGHSLKKFYSALNAVKRCEKKGRIAFYGDSFIEGDIFCSDVRNSLQDFFGGNGVGFVPITSEVAQFRNTVSHAYKGFKSFTVVKKDSTPEPYGIGGTCFTAGEENDLIYSVNPKNKHLDLFRDIKLFYTSPENTVFQYQLNNNNLTGMDIVASDKLQQLTFNGINATSVKFRFPASDTIKLYGVSFEDSQGIFVDNFGLRGNSGLGLSKIADQMHIQFDQFQHYQLIILQYGLNVIAPDTKDLSWYVKPMTAIIQRLKHCYPDAAILLMSVSDRSTKVDGSYRTMESVPMMVAAQREIAKESQIAFFNLYESMGGENSMIDFVDHQPPLANKDYTHLNFQGGRRVAGIFVKTLMNEYQKYNDQINKSASADSSLAVSAK